MEGTREIYIVLTDTGTWFTRVIKQFTRAPLNHASISFDDMLTEVYSFGRKKVNIPWSGGLVKENMYEEFFGEAPCAIYRCEVSAQEYRLLYNQVQDMMQDKERFKYNLIGLFGVLLRKKIERKDAYFCSHFVASLFEGASIPIVNKPSYWVTPSDIACSQQVSSVYEGRLNGYLYGVTALTSQNSA
jgi:hypothetical protein